MIPSPGKAVATRHFAYVFILDAALTARLTARPTEMDSDHRFRIRFYSTLLGGSIWHRWRRLSLSLYEDFFPLLVVLFVYESLVTTLAVGTSIYFEV